MGLGTSCPVSGGFLAYSDSRPDLELMRFAARPAFQTAVPATAGILTRSMKRNSRGRLGSA